MGAFTISSPDQSNLAWTRLIRASIHERLKSYSAPSQRELLLCVNETRNPKVIWEEPRRHPSRQRITTPQRPHWLQWDAPRLPQNCPFPSTISTTISHPSLDRPISPPQTATRSNQPFFHHSPTGLTDRPTDRQTDRPTDGIGDKSVPTSTYALLIVQRRS